MADPMAERMHVVWHDVVAQFESRFHIIEIDGFKSGINTHLVLILLQSTLGGHLVPGHNTST